jgi:4-hydroxy-3-polyprenylbenzoate decarboxylase
LLIWCDQAAFTAATLRNFLWVSFTRCNPSHDIYGIDAFNRHKHFGCRGPLVIDARIKPHHAPAVEMDPLIEKRVERLFEKGGSLNRLLS